MDIDTLVTDADPARHIDLGEAASPSAARLYQRIVALPPGRPGRALRRRAPARRFPGPAPGRAWLAPARRIRARTVIISLAAAVAAAALAVALLPSAVPRPGPAGAVRPGAASVAAVLDAAAVTAARGADAGQPPGPGQYLYVKEIEAKGLDSARGCAAPPMTVQAWVAADGSGRQIGRSLDRQCARLDFDMAYSKGGLPWWLFGAVQANTLPTSPAALQRAIVRRFEHGHSRPSATFVYAATFLNAGSPAALRAALYQVINSLPGVQDLGPVTDRLGRPGLGIGLVTTGTRDRLIFDPVTTAVLEQETVAVGPPQPANNMVPAGTVLQYTLYQREGVVSSVTATPPPLPSAGSSG
jgi:hypothetical protein